MPSSEPRRIGPYEIDAVLGRGGTAEVYRARREGGRDEVALKVLRPGSSRKERKAFVDEARLAAGLDSPHLVREVDSDLSANRPWVAMELVRGETLEELLRTSPERIQALAPRLCTSLLQALKALQEAGLTHRDVTPANILVSDQGRVRLVDMGSLSKPGPGVTGTLAYMSPESLRGARQDTRADVYQVGAVLYEVLSGFVPHEDSGGSYLDFRIDDEPAAPLVDVATGVSPAVSRLVSRLLAPLPEDRPSVEDALFQARDIPAPWAHTPPAASERRSDARPAPVLPGRARRRRRAGPGPGVADPFPTSGGAGTALGWGVAALTLAWVLARLWGGF